jgi:hypothetical protein
MSFQSAKTLFERVRLQSILVKEFVVVCYVMDLSFLIGYQICEFIDDNAQEFFAHSGMLQLPKKILGRIMERELDVPEIVKFTTCLAWGEANCHRKDNNPVY